MAAFGVYKSLDLLDKNADLGYSLALLNSRLEEMRAAVKDVQAQLAESGIVNEQLTNEVVQLKTALAEKESRIGQYHKYAVLLKKKMSDVGAVNEELAREGRAMRDLLTRVRLENQELRGKMASVKELRLAIQELQRRPQPVRRRERSAGRVPSAAPRRAGKQVAPELPDPEIVMGNEGFFVRDGVSTFFDKVDIRVRPVVDGVNPTQ